MEYDIFISYSRKDGAVVQSVVDRLKAEGYCCWMDVTGIESSDEFKRVLVKAIRQSKVVLFFSSVNSNNTEWTVKEINIAVQMKKPIIPVRLDDAPYDDSILFDLSGLDYIPYQQISFYNEGYAKLTRSLIKHCGERMISNGTVGHRNDLHVLNQTHDTVYAAPRRSRVKTFGIIVPLVLLSGAFASFVFVRHMKMNADAICADVPGKQADLILDEISGSLLDDEIRMRNEIIKWPANLTNENGIARLIPEMLELEGLIQDWKWLNTLSDSNVVAAIEQKLRDLRKMNSEIKQAAPKFGLSN